MRRPVWQVGLFLPCRLDGDDDHEPEKECRQTSRRTNRFQRQRQSRFVNRYVNAISQPAQPAADRASDDHQQQRPPANDVCQRWQLLIRLIRLSRDSSNMGVLLILFIAGAMAQLNNGTMRGAATMTK